MSKEECPPIEREALLVSSFLEKWLRRNMGKIGNRMCLFIGIGRFNRAVGSEGVRIEGQEWVKGSTVDVQGVQKSTVRMSRIYERAEHVGIKCAVYRKTCHLPSRRVLQKSKVQSLKKWPKQWGVMPQSQPPTSPKSMHLRLSPLWVFKGRQVASSRRTRVS